MKKILKLMMVACLFMSLFTNCSDKDDDDPIIITSLTVDKTSFSVEATASNVQISVLSNKEWTAKVEADASWLSISPSSGKADSKLNVDISISANSGTEARSATITITAADKKSEVKVDQKGKVIIPGIEIADAKYKQYLVEAFDTDKDGEISTGEAEAVKEMNLSGKGVESLSGIEFFVNLESLNCNNNLLTTLDISKNTLLTTFSCDSNKIDSLGLQANTLLKVVSCSSNEMTKIDLSNNKELTDLNCSSNKLKGLNISSNASPEISSEDIVTTSARLDISNNTLLKTLDCSKNELTILDISNNTELTTLICSWNNLTLLDVRKNSKLTKLDSRNNESLGKILLAKDQVITELLYDENVTTLEYPAVEKKLVSIPDAKFKANLVGLFDTDKDGEISEEEALEIKEIRCYGKDISSLTGIASFVNLEILDCANNNLSAIDISANLKLKEFDCSSNPLTFVDVSKNTALTKLSCYSCKLTAINVESNINLIDFNFANNKIITMINLLNNTALQRLYCQGNDLVSLDLRKNLQLKLLNCRDNGDLEFLFLEENFVIETLFIDTPPTTIIYPNYLRFKDPIFHKYLVDNFDSDNDGNLSDKEAYNIKEIDCSNLGISSLEGLNLIANLTSLNCSGNNLSSIDVRTNTALRTLKCDSSKLTSIDVSKNILLETLSISNNSIKVINVKSNTNLKYLNCNNNLIFELVLYNNKKLETLMCQDNVLSALLYLNNLSSLKMVDCSKNSKLKVIYLQTDYVVETIIFDEDNAEIRYLDETVVIDPDPSLGIRIPDPSFKAILLDLCDSNKDGVIMEDEAKTVTDITCTFQGITSLEGIEHFTNLVYLNCNSNSLTSLSLSQNKKLKELNCYSNSLTSLDITGCGALTKLICGANRLSELNLSKNKNLTFLDCSSNRLKVLNVCNNPSIGTIVCSGNQGSVVINIFSSQHPTITGDYTRSNQGFVVDFEDSAFEDYILNGTKYDSERDGIITESEALNITKIDCRSLGITSLKGIEKFANLTELNCFGNNLSGTLNMNSNPKLLQLVCDRNNLSSLDVSNCLSLSLLSCGNNDFVQLDLRINTSLSFLDCRGNSRLNSVKLDSSKENTITLYYDEDNTDVTYH